MPKLVFVNRFFYPDFSATSQMLSDAAFFLAARGHDVHVVTSRLVYEGQYQLPPAEDINGVTVHRIWTSSFGRDSLIGRACDYLTFYLSVFWLLVRLLDRDDTVVAKTDPPLVSIPVGFAAYLRGAKLVNWLQDLFPEVAVELGMQIPEWVVSTLTWLRDRTLLQAEQNIVIGEFMRNRVLKLGVYTHKVAVVPNWADGAAIVPGRDNNRLQRAWNLQDKFVVAYSGNLGLAHEIETLSGAITGLSKDPSIIFLFIGGGALLDELRSRLVDTEADNCVFQPYQPQDQLPQSLTLPDIHLVILKSELEGLIVPSKIYGVMAAGKPVLYIGSKNGEVAGIVESNGIGLCVTEGNSAELVSSILQLKDNRDDCMRMGDASRATFDKYYSRDSTLASLEKALV